MIDPDKFRSLANKGDVAGVAIATMVALGTIQQALEEIQAGRPVDRMVDKLGDDIKEIRNMFNELVVKEGE